ncbi:nitroreductase family protein [Nocardioides sp.]|uniref:nitroreductase family protein n=1 Tax=Nocardioides sp. TaxID=35761 RepID=UPI002B2718C7|nr:nitroreductase family protein [Nocardioides sp.]
MSSPHAPMPGAEGLAEPLRSRWSPSVFDADHVLADSDIETLLSAAQWAPSAGNSQPWGYVVVPRGTEAHTAFIAHLSRGNAGWVPRASLILVAGTQVGPAPDGRGPKSADYARHDLGQASAHITLQARSMGLHAHQFAGFDHASAAAELGVPDHVALMTGIAIGVHLEPGDPRLEEVSADDRAREERPRERKPLAEIAFASRWSQAWSASDRS